MSPCAKSKRGAVIYCASGDAMVGVSKSLWQVATGYNGPPGSVTCDGSAACRSSCRYRCEHAESRALLWAMTKLDSVSLSDFHRCDLVHVKIGMDGELEAGGGPSCVPCAVRILDVGVGAVWLYEAQTFNADGSPLHGMWFRYTAADFHRRSCSANEVY